jgi:hypothetical protein
MDGRVMAYREDVHTGDRPEETQVFFLSVTQYKIRKKTREKNPGFSLLPRSSGTGSGGASAAAPSSPVPGAAAPPAVAAIPAAGAAAAPANAGPPSTPVPTPAAVAHLNLHPATQEARHANTGLLELQYNSNSESTSVADPVLFWPLDTGRVKQSGSGIKNKNRIMLPSAWKPFFCAKILKFFEADPGRKKFGSWRQKFGFGIWNKHPGSETKESTCNL